MKKFFLSALISLCLVNFSISQSSSVLWYNQPAVEWEEALPVGNGRLGAMVMGLPGQEHLQLNEDSLSLETMKIGVWQKEKEPI